MSPHLARADLLEVLGAVRQVVRAQRWRPPTTNRRLNGGRLGLDELVGQGIALGAQVGDRRCAEHEAHGQAEEDGQLADDRVDVVDEDGGVGGGRFAGEAGVGEEDAALARGDAPHDVVPAKDGEEERLGVPD